MHSQGFDIRQNQRDRRFTLLIAGELDIATAPHLRKAVEEACEAGASEVVLDLSSVRFIDSSGLREILRARESCEERATELLAVPVLQPGPRRLFEVTRAGDVLHWCEPDAEAGGAAGGA